MFANHTSGSSVFPPHAVTPHQMRFDPLGAASARSDRLELPTSLHEFEGASELHDRVAHLVSHTLAPLTSYTGKKLFAYSYVKRGFKKASTTLGDLSLAEYNFVKLINSSVTSPADRPYMFQHLGNINEDAIRCGMVRVIRRGMQWHPPHQEEASHL